MASLAKLRTRWAAIGAACAVTLGGGALGIVQATVSTGDRAVYVPISPVRVLDTRAGVPLTNGTLKVVVEGAIVYANVVGASNQDYAVTTTTNSLGKFGLMLDPAKGNWQISIFPINKPGAVALRNKILDVLAPPSLSSNRDLGDIALVP